MNCPVCGFDNLTGTEVCDNCGADLAGHDIPQPALSFHGRLLGEHLDELGRPAAADGRSRDTPVERRDRPDAGRRGRTASWSPSTAGWSASSPTATPW